MLNIIYKTAGVMNLCELLARGSSDHSSPHRRANYIRLPFFNKMTGGGRKGWRGVADAWEPGGHLGIQHQGYQTP